MVVTSIPAALVGLLAEDVVDRALASPAFVGVGLLITGAVLWKVETARAGRMWVRGASDQGAGSAQRYLPPGCGGGHRSAIAVLPGISRSGLTISGSGGRAGTGVRG